MDLFWQLLEFDPFEKPVEKEFNADKQPEQLQKKQKDDIAYLGDIINVEEEEFKQLLKAKFEMFRQLLGKTIQHSEPKAQITIEQAKKISKYA